MPEKKPHLNLITIGHVDHGKSTTVGRILYETGAVSEIEIKKLKEEAKAYGKETFELAFVLDRLKEERERGLTIDLSHTRFETDKYYFTIIDAPGHRDFVKNMITGASQADAALLVVDAADGIKPQTREHTFLARTIGIPQLIVAINKMDRVNYDNKRYDELKGELEKLLKSVGYKPEQISFIPIASYASAENITKRNDKMKWYTGQTLIDAFNAIKIPEKPINLPLRIPVQDVYTITGIGTVPVGRVETGIIKTGETIIFEPAGIKGEVKSIEMHHETIPQAEPGDNIGFNVRGVGKGDIKRGDVAGHTDKPPTVVKEFTGQIVVIQHPTAIAAGYTPVFHAHTAQIACTFIELVKTIDPRTGETKKEKPDFLKTGDAAIVRFKPTRSLVLEKANEIPQLSRFAIRDMGMTIAAGVVLDIVSGK
ncbi:MAG: translation elongation factor EF-1 subunit alpha [Euryarchaeota archaeon]|nr:translation elongation factor EF-1 subunit alpha [Euryarchaeota archaeon]